MENQFSATTVSNSSDRDQAMREYDEMLARPLVNTRLLRVFTGNEWLRAAKCMAQPRELWLKTWYEGECCCLFADSNLGKSIYAVQIGLEVARMGKRVLYCDFELSEKQFQLRYTDEEGNLMCMPDTFYRADLNPEAELRPGESIDQAILRAIEVAAAAFRADTVIVDNITYLSMLTESGDTAAQLMVNLMRLKKMYGWSMMILAHTPKRLADSPLTANDLAGSKKLFNFFDCVLAIGRCLKDEGLRYVKQLKVRHGAFTYDAGNVVLYEIEKRGSYLSLHHRGYSSEGRMLEQPAHNSNAALIRRAIELRGQGQTLGQVAQTLGISVSTVSRICKAAREKQQAD